jgi:hypothetical protein
VFLCGSAGLAFAGERMPGSFDVCGVVDDGFLRSALGTGRRRWSGPQRSLRWVDRALEAAEAGAPTNPFPAAFKVFSGLARVENPRYGVSYGNVDLTHQHPSFPEVALALAGDPGFPEAFITHLGGERDVERDRFAESSYALVATA